MRIGIVGGTFDPFHRAHLEAPLGVFDRMGWSKLLFVPAFRQPYKLDQPTSSSFHRVAMTLLAIQDEPRAAISYAEVEKGEISYSIDTLRALRSLDREAILDWVIGDDNVKDLLGWRDLDGILEEANFVVLAREGPPDIGMSGHLRQQRLPETLVSRARTPETATRSGGIIFVHNEVLPISSTEIRRRVRAGEPVGELLDPRVARYVEKYGLYRTS